MEIIVVTMGTAKWAERLTFTVHFTLRNSYHEHVRRLKQKPMPVLFEILMLNTYSFLLKRGKACPEVTQTAV